MLINDILSACAAEISYEVRFGAKRFDMAAFKASPVPAIAIGLAAHTIILVVAEDGSMGVIESGTIGDDFDGLVLEAAKPTLNLAALPDAMAFPAVQKIDDMEIVFVGSFTGRPVLGAVSAGFRAQLGLAEDDPIEAVAAAARQAGGDPCEALAEIDAHSEALDEPFFHPQDQQSWSHEDAVWVENTLVDILATDPDYEGEEVRLLAAGADEHASLEVDYEPGTATGKRAIRILAQLTAIDDRFTGVAYEYNDGAASRRSGYIQTTPTIFEGAIEPVSEHERLAAYARLRDALGQKGLKAQQVRELLGTGAPQKDRQA